jgi:hypothetical protein
MRVALTAGCLELQRHVPGGVCLYALVGQRRARDVAAQLLQRLAVAGASATPPDDCGGVPGYMGFVQTMADPHDPEHAEMKDWIGRDSWDPAAFDIDNVNSWLAEIKL